MPLSLVLFLSACTELTNLRRIKEIQDEKIRELLAENEQYRKKYYEAIEERNTTVNQLNKSIAEQNTKIATLEKAKSDKEAELELSINTLNLQIKTFKNEIIQLNKINNERQRIISEKVQENTNLKNEINNLNAAISQKESSIANLNREITGYKNEIASLQDQINQLNDSLNQSNRELEKTKSEIKALSSDLDKAQKDYEKKLSQLPTKPKTDLSSLQKDIEKYLESKQIDYISVKDTQRGLVISIPSAYLFEGLADEIKPDIESILKELARFIKAYPKNDILVEGHTDDQPIKDSPFYDNLHLSSSRSLRITRFLITDCGIKSSRLYSVSAGEFHPIAKNTTPEGRKMNRRVDIVVLN